MKYIKSFEHNPFPFGKFYWGLRNESKIFKKQLEKIGCPKKNIDFLLKIRDYDADTIFVALESDYYHNYWKTSVIGFDPKEYEYKGPVSLTKEDVEQIEAEEAAEKYNI